MVMMKKKNLNIVYFVANWPSAISLLEISVLIVGIAVGVFIYFKMNQIWTNATSASSFDKETNQILVSMSLAHNNFNQLMQGSKNVDIEKDVYAKLDTAESYCSDLDQGGPGGKFVPIEDNTKLPNFQPVSVCDQLSTYRELLLQRWLDHLDGKPDTGLNAYEEAFTKTLQSMERFEGIADPHIAEADIQSQRANLLLCLGLVAIFMTLSFFIWRTRKTLSDQTRRLQSEVEIRSKLNTELDSERNFLNTLLDNIPDAVFAKDRSNRFTSANPAAARLMGESDKQSLIGKDESNFQPLEISQRILSSDAELLLNGDSTIKDEEIIFDKELGQNRWRQTTKAAIHDRNGLITGLVGISRDITEQKQTQEELKKANEKLTSGIMALEQNAHEMERLSEMVDLLQACPDTQEACVVIADQMEKFFPKDSGVLYLFHSSRNILEQAAAWGAPLPDAHIFKPDDCWGLRRGKMHIVENRFKGSKPVEVAQSLICPHITVAETSDYLCVPLVAQGEALRLLHLRHKDLPAKGEEKESQPDWYNQAKRRRIHTIVDSLSLSLANLKLRSTLKQQSIRDPLTGMFNRRYMEETLEREILRATRNNEPVGVIMLDIDHFKRFNDSFGHQAGDVLLQSLGHFFLAHVRGEDVACRYGGEEFILLLPGSNLEKSRERAEELREKVKYMNVNYQGQTLGTITLSFGVAVFPEHGTAPDYLVQAADQALYKAKSDGRDRVVVAD